MAKTFIYPTQDPSLKDTQLQLENDISILTEYQINANRNWRSSSDLNRIFGKLFNSQLPEVQNSSKGISRTTLQEALDFLNDFAPNRVYGFQKERKDKPTRVLFQLVIDEIEDHLGEIAKAIATRHELLSLYSQPGTFNKLLRIKKNISLLIKLFKENRFKQPERAYKVVYQELSGDRDYTDIGKKTINLLQSVHTKVASCLQKERKQIEMWQFKTIGEFMKACFDGVEVSTESILEQFSIHLEFEIPTDWFDAMKRNPTIRKEIQAFCHQFCSEEEHAAKIHLFHNFITEWLEKYPPDSKVGSEEILIYIQSVFILAGSPEFLLHILLLEQDSISFQPHAPTLMNSDYAPEEIPKASGICCYDYLNLMNALSAMSRKSSYVEMEIEALQKKGSLLYKKFNSTCNLSFLAPQKIPSDKRELEERLLHSASIIQIVYADRIKALPLTKQWQSDLIKQGEFINDASRWAASFCSEKNSIVKLNLHRDTVFKMVEKYVSFTHEPVDFLVALLKAANNPSVVVEIALIESNTVTWRISEGFVGDTPVNAAKRKEDLKDLQALIYQL